MKIKSITLRVENMICISCERKINNTLKNVKGVIEGRASYKNGTLYIKYDENLCSLKDIENILTDLGYSINKDSSINKEALSIAGILLIALVIFKLGQNSGSFDMSESLKSNIGYISLFFVGIFTSLHCIGMCGGIMMSQSLSFKEDKPLGKLKPSLFYNLGRLTSYTLLGGIVGAIGSVFSLSTSMQGLISLFAAVFMIIMGFNISGFKTFRRFSLNIPLLSANNNNNKNPFIVGLLNGLMPCGPLQTMQLYALATGSFISGALSMFFFALGTIPLMMSLGLILGSLSKNRTKQILKLSGIIIVVLGVNMAFRGLSLLDINLQPNISTETTDKNIATIEGDKQSVEISATLRGYEPNVIYLQKGIEADLIIQGERLTSCNNEIIIPSLNVRKKLSSGDNVITFSPESDINFSCWMGMKRGRIKVVDSLDNIDTSSNTKNDAPIYEEPKFFGIPISNVPTDRLIKRTTIQSNIQSINITSTLGDFEPSIIIGKENLSTLLSFNVEDSDLTNGKYRLLDSSLTKEITNFNIERGKGEVTLTPLEAGQYGLIKGNQLYGIIYIWSNPLEADLEEIRKDFF